MQFEDNLLTYLPRKYFIVYKMIANNKKTLIIVGCWVFTTCTAAHFASEYHWLENNSTKRTEFVNSK